MKTVVVVLFLLVSLGVFSQESWMHPNNGQWETPINYKIDLQLGAMFIEDDGFTYFLNNSKNRHNHTHSANKNAAEHVEEYQAHVIKSKFINSSWSGEEIKEHKSNFYSNYFHYLIYLTKKVFQGFLILFHHMFYDFLPL